MSVTRVGSVFNTAATSATDILSSDLTPVVNSTGVRVTICLETTDSVFSVQLNSGGTAKLAKFNGGTSLTAGVLYTFTFGASGAITYNFQCATSTTVMYLCVEEVTGDAL